MWLFMAFLAVPLIEIGLFVVVGGAIGVWATLAWVLLSGLIGIAVLRRAGMQGAAELRTGLRGIDPLSPVVRRVLTVLAGILLILPGFLTDALGLLLLLPPVQTLLIALLARRVLTSAGPRAARDAHRPEPGIIDAEFHEVGDEDGGQPPTRGPSGWTRH